MKLIFSLIILLLTISNSVNSLKWDHIHSNTNDGDVHRNLQYKEFEKVKGCPSFSSHGVSINGSSKGHDQHNVDTAFFDFSTCNMFETSFPSYFFRFFSFAKNSDDENSSGEDNGDSTQISRIASLFSPTFIIEYVESNKTEGFQYDEDEIVGYVNLAKLKYTLTKDQVELKGNDGNNFTVFQIDVTSTNGLFKMSFYISGASINVGDVSLSAQQSKMDIAINGYFNSTINSKDCPKIQIGNYSCSSSGPSTNSNSKIALTSFFATKSKNVEIDDIQSKIYDNNNGTLVSGFSWKSSVDASVNGKNTTVKIISKCTNYSNFKDFGLQSSFIKKSFPGDFSAQFLTFSFEGRADSYVWDPVMGVESDISTSSSSSNLIISSFFILISSIISLLLLL